MIDWEFIITEAIFITFVIIMIKELKRTNNIIKDEE